jgi:hypothetical protein
MTGLLLRPKTGATFPRKCRLNFNGLHGVISQKTYHVILQAPPREPKILRNYNFTCYRCENLSLNLKDEHRLMVSEKWVLRTIFGPGKEEVTGVSRDSHNEERNHFYSSLNIILVSTSKIVRRGKNVAWMWQTPKSLQNVRMFEGRL